MSNFALSKKKAQERIFVFQAVEYGYLKHEQLKECIDEQDITEPPIPLLTIAKQKGFLTPSQVNHLMSKRLDASVAKAFAEGLQKDKPSVPKLPPLDESEDKVAEVETIPLPKEEKEEYERQLAEQKRLLEREQKQKDFLKRKREELEKTLESFEHEKQTLLEKKQKEICTLESELLCYKGLHEQREQKLKTLESSFEEKETLLKREKEKARGLFNLMEQSGNELRDVEEKLSKTNALLEKEIKEREYLETKLEKENSEKSQYKKQFNDANKKIEELIREIEQIKIEGSKEEEKPKEVTDTKALDEDLEKKKKELEKKSREQTRLIAKLEERDRLQSDLESQLNKLKEEQAKVDRKVEEAKKQIVEEFEQEKNKMEEKFHKEKIALETDLSQFKQKSENLESKLQQYQETLGNWDEQEAVFKDQVASEQKKYVELEFINNGLQAKIKELEAQVAGLQQAPAGGELETGRILPGSDGEAYTVQKILGRGGMGITYSAIKSSDDSIVVVKTLLPEVMGDMKVVMRFVQEARTIMDFRHENLVQGYDVQQGKSLSYFVMEYLDGDSVEDILDEQAYIEPVRGTEIIFGIAKALEYMEKHHLVHRDVKPANILVKSDGTPKLVDFGIVKMTDRTCSLTTEGIILGTPYYLSPEQTYQTNVDIRSDIYSLGATFYHMVVGEVPFPGDNPIDVIQKRLVKTPKPGKVKTDLPKPVCTVIEKMMNKNIKKRHAKASDLVVELEGVLKKIKR